VTQLSVARVALHAKHSELQRHAPAILSSLWKATRERSSWFDRLTTNGSGSPRTVLAVANTSRTW
jgi:hypothetical protein